MTLEAVPGRLEAAAAAALVAVGVEGKRIAAHTLQADVGGGLSHFGRGRRRGGIKMSTGFDVAGDRMTLTPRPLGMWQLVTEGSSRSSWFIPRRRQFTKTGKVRKGARPVAYGSVVAWWVEHPRVRGHDTWHTVRLGVVDAARRVTVDAVVKAL
jgi:hypothetical protein